LLREHAGRWLDEWSALEQLGAELEALEARARERMKEAMQRASEAGAVEEDRLAASPLAARHGARMSELRAGVARRDVLLARRDLGEVSRARKGLERSKRDVLLRVRQLEGLLGESIELAPGGAVVQQLG